MNNVNFGTEPKTVFNRYQDASQTEVQTPRSIPVQPRDTFVSQNQQPVLNNARTTPSQYNNLYQQPARPQQRTQGQPPIYLPQLMQMQEPKKRNWDNLYRIASLGISAALVFIIGISMKPVIASFFKRHSNDLFRNFNDDKNIIDFDKLPGMKEAKQTFIENVINPIKYRDLYAKENVDMELACILHGPPGTGKTNFVYSAAKKLKAEVAEFDLSKEGSSYMNATAIQLKAKSDAIIAHAKKHPDKEYFVLFDEIEAILSDIKNPTSGAEQDRQLVIKTFLRIMDQFKAYKNIKVFATTNMTLDNKTGVIGNMNPAAMSRLGTKIFIDNPDVEAIESALHIYLGKVPMAKELLKNKDDIHFIATALLGTSYRDITGIIKDAIAKTMAQKVKSKKPDNVTLTRDIFVDAIRKFEKTNKELNLEAAEKTLNNRTTNSVNIDELESMKKRINNDTK